MRALIFVVMLTLAACVQREGPTRPGGGDSACARTQTHALMWSSQTDADVVSASSQGPSCEQAVITLVVRTASGDPLWTFSNTYYDLHTGGVAPAGVTAPAVTVEEMEKFLQSLANVTQMRSSQLPDWAQGAAGPADPARTLHYSSTYQRDAYEALRASDRALLCYAAAAETTQCLIIDPASNAAHIVVAFGP
jgi:hypothetical protein